MKVLFINPPYRPDTVFVFYEPYIPRSLIVMAGCIRKERPDVEVKIHDMPILLLENLDRVFPKNQDSEIDWTNFNGWYPSIEKVTNEYDPDIIGITIHAAPSLPSVALSLKSAIKASLQRGKKPIIIAGGLLPSILKDRLLELLSDVDILLLGEAENTITELIEALEEGRDLHTVPGIAFRKSGHIIETFPRLFDKVISYPLPAYDLLPLDLYYRFGLVPHLETTRGCPFRCKFCGATYPQNKGLVRQRPMEDLLAEINHLLRGVPIVKEGKKRVYKFRTLYFCDDTFTLDRERVMNLCQELKERIDKGYLLGWRAVTRVDLIDPPLLKVMKESGCNEIGLGIEVGSEEGLKKIGKGTSVERNLAGITMVEEAGIHATALIIIGFPHETPGDIQQTARFLVEQGKPSHVQPFIFHPVPGTHYFDILQESKKIDLTNIDNWIRFDHTEEPISDTPYLEKNDIIKYYIKFTYAFPSVNAGKGNKILQKRLSKNGGEDEVPIMQKGILAAPADDGMILYFHYHDSINNEDYLEHWLLLNKFCREVLIYCNGDLSIKEIVDSISKIFSFSISHTQIRVLEVLEKLEKNRVIWPLQKKLSKNKKDASLSRFIRDDGIIIKHGKEDPYFLEQKNLVLGPKLKKGVVFAYIGNGKALYYNPSPPSNLGKGDLWRNVFRMGRMGYEVMLRCNGVYPFSEIVSIIERLFSIDYAEAEGYVHELLGAFYKLNLLENPLQ